MEYHTSTDQRCEQSALELEILSRLTELGIPIVPQVKLVNNWVFDAAVNGTRIIIEVNGDYWHNLEHVKDRDARKRAWCEQNGFTLIAIGEAAYTQDPDGTILSVAALIEQLMRAAPALPAPSNDGTSARSATKADSVTGFVSDRRTDHGAWRQAFLDALEQTGVVGMAAKKAGVSRTTIYEHYNSDPEFATAWREAIESRIDRIEANYLLRGELESNRAAEKSLAAYRAERWRPVTRQEVTGKNGGPLEQVSMSLDEWKAQAAERLRSAAETLDLLDELAPDGGPGIDDA
jgi:very-short-patch-repair endonuclease